MSAARLFASALVFCGFVTYGAVSGARKRTALNQATALLKDLNELSSRMELTRLPLKSISEALARSGALPELWKELCCGLSSGLSPERAWERQRVIAQGSLAAKVMRELFAAIGSSDIEAETRRISLAATQLASLLKEQKAEAERSVKLTGSLSVLMGLAAALLLL